MAENIVIDIPERIENDIEDFKLRAAEKEKNYTTAKIKLCRDPENDKPLLFYTQELVRNFKEQADPFGKRHIIKAFTPSNHHAVADTSLERKFKDTVLAHKDNISDYSPLTDIHSGKMGLFIDEDTAQFMEDVGMNIESLGEEFESIESVSASKFHEDLSTDVTDLKRELRALQDNLRIVKRQIADEFGEWVDPDLIPDEEFSKRIALENVTEELSQRFLALTERIARLCSKLGELSAAVFSDTSTRIKLPKAMEVNDVVFTL